MVAKRPRSMGNRQLTMIMIGFSRDVVDFGVEPVIAAETPNPPGNPCREGGKLFFWDPRQT
jgi:hypothetical protein